MQLPAGAAGAGAAVAVAAVVVVVVVAVVPLGPRHDECHTEGPGDYGRQAT